jgi:hypothetical protein
MVDTKGSGGDGMSRRSDAPHEQGVEAQKQFIQTMRGIKVGNYEYKKALPMIENATYALRVVAYKGSVFRSFRGYRFDVLFGDKRIDLTIAFRVVRKDTDGSATLVWKEIERREAPLHVSKVALEDPKTGKPTRVRFEERDGKKVRVAVRSGELING